MGTNMMIFLVIIGILLFIGLPIIAIIEARRMDKRKGSLLSKKPDAEVEEKAQD